MNLRRVATVRAAVLGLLALSSSCNSYDAGLLSGQFSAPRTDAGTEPQPYVTTCGNGLRDDGELCDIAIADGQPGACPTTCEGDDPCYLQASAGTDCQLQCVGLMVTKAINDDGCCPKDVGPGEDSDCGGCGDGIIGPRETCEGANCPLPAGCGRISACLVGVFSGNPDACTSKCELQVITLCKNGDGCCPPGCNPDSDNDCSPSCGNGTVEPELGETCERPPSAMACADSCDDGIACTHDVASGSAENCTLTCTNIDITAPADGDGCCPMGANALIDSDCAPVCGNQVHEAGEMCDPCPTGCNDGDPCTADTLSGSGCNATCSFPQITAPRNGDSCCPSGANATNDNDCASNCGNGVTEPGEECDGGPLCRDCALLFDSSLVHRYSFNGSGNTITDSVGTAHGTGVNCSVANGAIDLSSGVTGNYVSLPGGLISGLSRVTFEVWLKWDGGANRQRIFDFGCNSGSVGTSFFMLEPANSSGKMASYVNFTPATSDSANDWSVLDGAALSQSGTHHVAVTFTGTRLSLYLDGVWQASTDAASKSLSLIDDCNDWLGRSQFSADPELDATLYEFRIYSKALSDSQISASYSRGQNP